MGKSDKQPGFLTLSIHPNIQAAALVTLMTFVFNHFAAEAKQDQQIDELIRRIGTVEHICGLPGKQP